RIASQFFLKGVQDGSTKLTELFGKVLIGALGGQTVNPQDPKYQAEGGADLLKKDLEAQAHQQQAIMGTFQGAIGLVGQTLTVLDNAKKGQETSVVGSTLSFAAMGASIGALFTPI